MADFPIYDGSVFEAMGVSAVDSGGTQLTSSVTAHTKGAWQQVVAAASEGITSFFVHIHNPTLTGAARLAVDIGIGATEVVLVPNLRIFTRVLHGGSCFFYIPMAIPGGEKISARMQSGTTGSITCDISMGALRGGFLASPPLSLATHYGFSSASTMGTEVDPGAVANTKGADVELTASCSQIRSLMIILGNGTTAGNPPVRSASDYLLDIGIGAHPETYIISNLAFTTRTADDGPHPSVIGPIDCFIPAGTRIVARAQSTENASPPRTFDISLLGFN